MDLGLRILLPRTWSSSFWSMVIGLMAFRDQSEEVSVSLEHAEQLLGFLEQG